MQPSLDAPAGRRASTSRPLGLSEGLTRLIVCRLASAVFTRRIPLAVGLALSAAAALAGSTLLAKKSWEVEATLVYAPLPVPDDGKGLYVPPDLKTLSSLVNTPATLEEVRKEFKIDLPVKTIDKNLVVTIPNGTKALKLTLTWDDGPRATAMLNRVTDLFIDQVARLRREKLAGHVTDFQHSLADTQARLKGAIEDLRAFHRREKLDDYRNDATTYHRQLLELEASVTQHKRTEADTLAQMKRMSDYLTEIKAQQEAEAEAEKQFQASTETVADNRRRQDRLRELITEERRIQEIQAQIEAKKKEYDRVYRLHARGAASRAEVDLIYAELGVLQSRIKDGEKIRAWQEELEKIDKVVVPAGNKKNSGSPIIQQVLFRKLELELQLTALREEMTQIEKHIKERREQLERLDRLRGEYESLTRKVESLDAERLQIETTIAGMRNLQNIKAAEFVVASRAETPPYPASSNKKFLIIEFGGGGVVLCLGAGRGRADRDGLVPAARGISARVDAGRLGRPEGRAFRGQQLRGLALRLRQFLPEPGAMVVFTTLSEPGSADGTLEELAAYLAMRDERLLLDVRLASAGRPAGRAARAARPPACRWGASTPPASRPASPRGSSPATGSTGSPGRPPRPTRARRPTRSPSPSNWACPTTLPSPRTTSTTSATRP
ncbi:MAG: hypothetical protein U0835_02835 [Isosphaeraceae bacterium]